MADRHEAMKRRVARRAVEEVRDGMVVGLGSGSTAGYAIEALGEAGLDVSGVATSRAARSRAIAAGVPVVDLEAVDAVDIAIDGADQVAGDTVLKGGGGAHALERVVDDLAERLVVVVDERKPVARLDAPVPLEVLPEARGAVEARLERLGAEVADRRCAAVDGPVHSERGLILLDADVGPIDDPAALSATLAELPGVLDHGLFVGMADEVLVGTAAGVEVRTPG
ncbi:MAG: ribose-5-phosphate isomerase RpiA [Halobacteriales archaeon]